MRQIYRFFKNTEATTAVEYSVMLAMILIAVIAGVGAVGSQSGGMWGSIQSGLAAAGFGGS